MTRILLACLLLLSFSARAQTGSDAAIQQPDAFERGFAVSLYVFDACGDPLAGRVFRRALAEKFAHCPFSPEARGRYAQRTRAQQAKVRKALDEMIESRGGLPMRLEGMSMTCREQQSSDGYRELRSRLDAYAGGNLAAEAVITGACDAADIHP